MSEFDYYPEDIESEKAEDIESAEDVAYEDTNEKIIAEDTREAESTQVTNKIIELFREGKLSNQDILETFGYETIIKASKLSSQEYAQRFVSDLKSKKITEQEIIDGYGQQFFDIVQAEQLRQEKKTLLKKYKDGNFTADDIPAFPHDDVLEQYRQEQSQELAKTLVDRYEAGDLDISKINPQTRQLMDQERQRRNKESDQHLKESLLEKYNSGEIKFDDIPKSFQEMIILDAMEKRKLEILEMYQNNEIRLNEVQSSFQEINTRQKAIHESRNQEKSMTQEESTTPSQNTATVDSVQEAELPKKRVRKKPMPKVKTAKTPATHKKSTEESGKRPMPKRRKPSLKTDVITEEETPVNQKSETPKIEDLALKENIEQIKETHSNQVQQEYRHLIRQNEARNAKLAQDAKVQQNYRNLIRQNETNLAQLHNTQENTLNQEVANPKNRFARLAAANQKQQNLAETNLALQAQIEQLQKMGNGLSAQNKDLLKSSYDRINAEQTEQNERIQEDYRQLIRANEERNAHKANELREKEKQSAQQQDEYRKLIRENEARNAKLAEDAKKQDEYRKLIRENEAKNAQKAKEKHAKPLSLDEVKQKNAELKETLAKLQQENYRKLIRDNEAKNAAKAKEQRDEAHQSDLWQKRNNMLDNLINQEKQFSQNINRQPAYTAPYKNTEKEEEEQKKVAETPTISSAKQRVKDLEAAPTATVNPTVVAQPTVQPRPTVTVNPTVQPRPTVTVNPTTQPRPTATVSPIDKNRMDFLDKNRDTHAIPKNFLNDPRFDVDKAWDEMDREEENQKRLDFLDKNRDTHAIPKNFLNDPHFDVDKAWDEMDRKEQPQGAPRREAVTLPQPAPHRIEPKVTPTPTRKRPDSTELTTAGKPKKQSKLRKWFLGLLALGAAVVGTVSTLFYASDRNKNNESQSKDQQPRNKISYIIQSADLGHEGIFESVNTERAPYPGIHGTAPVKMNWTAYSINKTTGQKTVLPNKGDAVIAHEHEYLLSLMKRQNIGLSELSPDSIASSYQGPHISLHTPENVVFDRFDVDSHYAYIETMDAYQHNLRVSLENMTPAQQIKYMEAVGPSIGLSAEQQKTWQETHKAESALSLKTISEDVRSRRVADPQISLFDATVNAIADYRGAHPNHKALSLVASQVITQQQGPQPASEIKRHQEQQKPQPQKGSNSTKAWVGGIAALAGLGLLDKMRRGGKG